MKKESQHIYTAKRYVLWTIRDKEWELGNYIYKDIYVFQHKDSKEAEAPDSYEELCELLRDVERVYDFYPVKDKDGNLGYDIIIEE